MDSLYTIPQLEYDSTKKGRTYIYILVDPFTEEIRYVGKTINPQTRLRDHLRLKKNVHRANWIQSVVDKGAVPIFQIVDNYDTENVLLWARMEQFWIAYLQDQGCRLTNLMFREDEGFVHSKESREKMSQTRKGRLVGDETREKLRIRGLNRTHRPEVLAALSAKAKERGQNEEFRKKISDSHKRRWESIAVEDRKLTGKQLEAIRNGAKNRSPEGTARIVEAVRRPKSEETKKKMAEAAKRRWSEVNADPERRAALSAKITASQLKRGERQRQEGYHRYPSYLSPDCTAVYGI